MIDAGIRTIDTDLYDKGENDPVPEVKFAIDFPILCRTKSASSLVMTNLADRLQNQIEIILDGYRLVSFLNFNEHNGERNPSTFSFIVANKMPDESGSMSGSFETYWRIYQLQFSEPFKSDREITD